jgi:hypothetical protein
METLKRFASVDECRWVLTLPRRVGDVWAATDGRVLVEVPAGEVEEAEVEIREGHFPEYGPGILEPAFEPDLVPMSMPPLPPRAVKMVRCFDCRGQGHFSNGMGCEECDGKGEWEDSSEWAVRTEGASLSAMYVEKVMALPNLRWFFPAKPGEPVRFTFGEAGRGLLMPLRVDPEEQAEERKPSALETLGKVIRREADDIGRGSSELSAMHAAELIRCLARMVEGKSVTQALGAPGDWGYDSDLGKALLEVYKEG